MRFIRCSALQQAVSSIVLGVWLLTLGAPAFAGPHRNKPKPIKAPKVSSDDPLVDGEGRKWHFKLPTFDEFGNKTIYEDDLGNHMPGGYTLPADELGRQITGCKSQREESQLSPYNYQRENGLQFDAGRWAYPTAWQTPSSLVKRHQKKWQNDGKSGKFVPPNINMVTMFVPLSTKQASQSLSSKHGNPETTRGQLVHMQIDKQTNRIIGFTVETKMPPGSIYTNSTKTYYDPRISFPSNEKDGEPYPLSPFGDLSETEPDKRAAEFDHVLDMLMLKGGTYECPFYKDSKASLADTIDPAQKSIDAFFNTCDKIGKETPYPCCNGAVFEQGKGVDCDNAFPYVTNKVTEAAKTITSVQNVKDTANWDLNQELIYELRQGLVNTQAAILTTTGPGIKGIEDFEIGLPNSSDGASDASKDDFQCKGNAELKASAKAYTDQYRIDGVEGKERDNRINTRKTLEWDSLKSLAQQIMQVQWARCVKKHNAIFGGHDQQADPVYYGALNHNRLLGMIEYGKLADGGIEQDTSVTGYLKTAVGGGAAGLQASHYKTYDMYKSVKKALTDNGIGQDIDWSVFEYEENPQENRYKCSGPDGMYNMNKLVQEMDAIHPNPPPGSMTNDEDLERSKNAAAALMDTNGFLGQVRGAKKVALGYLRGEIKKYSKQCKDAFTTYNHNWIASDDGLSLWMNHGLVAKVARKLAESGDFLQLARFQWTYCTNAANKEHSEKNKMKFMMAAAAFAIVIPVGGAFIGGALGSGAVAANTLFLAKGMAAGLAIADFAMASKSYADAKEAASLTDAAYAAALNEAQDMDEARKEVFVSLCMMVGTGLLGAVDLFAFVKSAGMALKSGRVLTHAEEDVFKMIANAAKKNTIPSDIAELLIKRLGKCNPSDKNCGINIIMQMANSMTRHSVERRLIQAEADTIITRVGNAKVQGKIVYKNGKPMLDENGNFFIKLEDGSIHPVSAATLDSLASTIPGRTQSGSLTLGMAREPQTMIVSTKMTIKNGKNTRSVVVSVTGDNSVVKIVRAGKQEDVVITSIARDSKGQLRFKVAHIDSYSGKLIEETEELTEAEMKTMTAGTAKSRKIFAKIGGIKAPITDAVTSGKTLGNSSDNWLAEYADDVVTIRIADESKGTVTEYTGKFVVDDKTKAIYNTEKGTFKFHDAKTGTTQTFTLGNGVTLAGDIKVSYLPSSVEGEYLKIGDSIYYGVHPDGKPKVATVYNFRKSPNGNTLIDVMPLEDVPGKLPTINPTTLNAGEAGVGRLAKKAEIDAAKTASKWTRMMRYLKGGAKSKEPPKDSLYAGRAVEDVEKTFKYHLDDEVTIMTSNGPVTGKFATRSGPSGGYVVDSERQVLFIPSAKDAKSIYVDIDEITQLTVKKSSINGQEVRVGDYIKFDNDRSGGKIQELYRDGFTGELKVKIKITDGETKTMTVDELGVVSPGKDPNGGFWGKYTAHGSVGEAETAVAKQKWRDEAKKVVREELKIPNTVNLDDVPDSVWDELGRLAQGRKNALSVSGIAEDSRKAWLESIDARVKEIFESCTVRVR